MSAELRERAVEVLDAAGFDHSRRLIECIAAALAEARAIERQRIAAEISEYGQKALVGLIVALRHPLAEEYPA